MNHVRRPLRLCAEHCTILRRLLSFSVSEPTIVDDTLPPEITVVEVGPRDGLQNEKNFISVAHKIQLIDLLADCGLPVVEAGSFVSPKWVPQMAATEEVMMKIARRRNVAYPVLVPNLQGLEKAYNAQVDHIAVFAAASEGFSSTNINCSIDESLRRFAEVCEEAKKLEMRIRGYVSCVIGCPYEGAIAPAQVARVTSELFAMGCEEVSLGDTIGVGTAGSFTVLLNELRQVSSLDYSRLAVHCHDTYGQALANVLTAINVGRRLLGISTVDSSVAGLGGCPYAAGASGNMATEDLVYMLNGLGVRTMFHVIEGVDLRTLITVGAWVSGLLDRQPASRVTVAEIAKLHKQCHSV